MKSLGGFLVFIGGVSFLLNLMNYEFSVLMWIDSWGRSTGNIIRIGIVVVGAILYLAGSRKKKSPHHIHQGTDPEGFSDTDELKNN